MFKVGDIVRVNDTFPGYKNYRFKIIKTYISDTHRRPMFVLISEKDGFERHFLSENLEKNSVYERKQKIKKICSKLGTV